MMRFRTLTFLAGFLLAGSAPLHAVDVPDGPVILLPPLEVSASLHAIPWRYAEVERVEILSSCSDSITRDFIAAEHRIEQFFAALVPPEFQVRLGVPKVIVLSEQRRAPSASQELLQGLGKGDAPPGKARDQVRFIPNLRLNDPDAVIVFAMIDASRFNPDQIGLTADHVRFVLDQRTPPLPAWLVEGMTLLAARMTYNREAVNFAAADWTPAEAAALREEADAPRTLLAMRDLLEPPRPPENAEAARLWRAQAALFIRWVFEGDEMRRQRFWEFVRRSVASAPTEVDFESCLGMSYADARDVLSDYLPSALRTPFQFRPRAIPPLPEYRLRPATPAEIGRLKGDWERLEISYVRARFPDFVARYEEQAARTLSRAYALDKRDPRLAAVLGLHACDVGRDDEARPLLETAAAAGVVRPRVHFELARLRYVQALASPAGTDGKLSREQVNAVLEPLRTAHAQLPPLAQTYALTAELWQTAGLRLGEQHFALLDEGLRLFPTQLNLLYQVAALKLLHGAREEATTLIERGLQISPTPAARAGFERLHAILKE